jgi:D-glycero-D-manno-heptose 1,7-bisphosphate phosphatase
VTDERPPLPPAADDRVGSPKPEDVRRYTRHAMAVTGEQSTSLREVRPAIFFDRDGTLIKDVGYIKNPDDVELSADAAGAVRRMNYALWPVIVVTNQSGIARGMSTEWDYERVREKLDDMLAERGAYVDAHYHCPHHPDFTGPCECRKPGTLLFDRAIVDHAIDPTRSVFVGDRLRDILPSKHYGARGILVPGPATPADELETARQQFEVAATLSDAVHMILHV